MRRRREIEIVVEPARSLALAVGLFILIALLSVWLADIAWFAALGMSVAGLGIGSAAVHRLIKPGLLIRLDGRHLHYRRGQHWISHVGKAFVSPWFIGWQGTGLTGIGVFSVQLPRDDFRRLAKTLRYGGSDVLE